MLFDSMGLATINTMDIDDSLQLELSLLRMNTSYIEPYIYCFNNLESVKSVRILTNELMTVLWNSISQNVRIY